MGRFKNRWILVDFKPVAQGIAQLGKSGSVKYLSPTTNICIFQVAHDQHNIAWGALTLLTIIEGVTRGGGHPQFV
ncbi:hypothetical protein BDZ97DRAFT_1883802 [Flammula alnicola]|nr:hypothetical protein BDZ97DRAFT_1883802 [Flammula alnicola]